MAQFPCQIGGHRYVGPQRTVYPAIVEGARTDRRKWRLCPAHFAVVLERLGSLAKEDIFQDELPDCCEDGEVRHNAALFVTYFEPGQERADLYGACHWPCGVRLLDAIGGRVLDV